MDKLCTVVVTLLLVIVPLAMAWGRYRDDDDDDGTVDLFTNLQRRGGWCARWGEYCVPDAKMRVAGCCKGLRCVCGKFWAQSRCQCKSGSALFGK